MELDKRLKIRKKYVLSIFLEAIFLIMLLGCSSDNGNISNSDKNKFESERTEFSKDWYEVYSLFESATGDLLKIEMYDDGLTHITINDVEFFACDSEIYVEGEDGSYIYDDYYDDFMQLRYYPTMNQLVLNVMGEETTYYLIENIYGPDQTIEFSEDWYLNHFYYKDSNGNYFILKHSDSIFQINIDGVGEFNVDFSKYRVETDENGGEVYVYYDKESYALIKYYPQLGHLIKIETDSGNVVCTNVSDEEFLEAERNYADSQMEGFEEYWYIDKYISSSSYETWRDSFLRDGDTFDEAVTDIRPISYKQITDTCDLIMLEVAPPLDYMSEKPIIDFLSDSYSLDYENYGYLYESTYLDTIVYLEYFPKDNKIKVYDEYEHMGNMVIGKETYYILTGEQVEDLMMINK